MIQVINDGVLMTREQMIEKYNHRSVLVNQTKPFAQEGYVLAISDGIFEHVLEDHVALFDYLYNNFPPDINCSIIWACPREEEVL